MRQLWTHRTIEAPASQLWALLTDPAQWPHWGPSVRAATIDAETLDTGVRGRVRTIVGLELPFTGRHEACTELPVQVAVDLVTRPLLGLALLRRELEDLTAFGERRRHTLEEVVHTLAGALVDALT